MVRLAIVFLLIAGVFGFDGNAETISVPDRIGCTWTDYNRSDFGCVTGACGRLELDKLLPGLTPIGAPNEEIQFSGLVGNKPAYRYAGVTNFVSKPLKYATKTQNLRVLIDVNNDGTGIRSFVWYPMSNVMVISDFQSYPAINDRLESRTFYLTCHDKKGADSK